MLKVLQVGGDFDSSKGMPTYVAECWSMHVCLGLVVCFIGYLWVENQQLAGCLAAVLVLLFR